MSNRTVFAWLGVAIAIGVAAFIVLRTGRTGGSGAVVPTGQRVLAFEPSKVVSLSVDREIVSRRPGTDEWSLAEAGGGSWPVASSRITPMLRLLADMRATADADPKATPGDDAPVVKIALDEGSPITLRFASKTLAGAGLVAVEGGAPPAGEAGENAGAGTRLAMVADNIERALTNPGPRGWRSTSVLAGFDANPARIRLKNASGVLALRRVENRWGITEPLVAPADPASVAKLTKALAEAAITDFLDTPPAAATPTGLDPASDSVTLESDGAPPGAGSASGAATPVARRTIDLGSPADSSGKRLYARIDGTRTVVVDATSLAGVALTPAAYIAGTASALTGPDVGSVVMSGAAGSVSRRLVRETDGWTEVMASGRGSLLPEADRNAVNDALKYLIERPATDVAITAPKGYTPVGTLELGGLDGRALETFEVGASDGPMLTLKSGSVYRSYPLSAAPAVLRAWAEPSAPKPPGPDTKSGDPMK
jgi:hypothetical protein